MALTPNSLSPAHPGAWVDLGPRIPSLEETATDVGGRGAAPAHECLHLKDHFSQELWLHVLSTVDDTTVYQDIASSHSRWHRISAKLPDGAWEPRGRGHPGEASAHLVQSCSGFVWVGVTPPQPTPDLRMRPCGPWDCGRGGSEAGQQYRWRV